MKFGTIGPVVSEETSFETVDRRRTMEPVMEPSARMS